MKGTAGHAPLTLSSRGARCGAGFVLDLHRPLEGSNNVYALPCAASGGGAAPDSDVLIVRHVDPAAVSASAERLQVYSTRGGEGSALFHSGTAPGPLAGDPAGAQVHDLSVHAYYIARHSTGQTGLPALRRKMLQGGPASGPNISDEEIMPGVEDLQVQFGIDPGADGDGDGIPDDRDGDGQPDRYTGTAALYVNPGDAALAGAVVLAARIWIRVRAERPEPGFIDNSTYRYADVTFQPSGEAAAYRRLLVSRTIQLRNAWNLMP